MPNDDDLKKFADGVEARRTQFGPKADVPPTEYPHRQDPEAVDFSVPPIRPYPTFDPLSENDSAKAADPTTEGSGQAEDASGKGKNDWETRTTAPKRNKLGEFLYKM